MQTWMLYTAVVSVLFGAGAWALEGAQSLRGRATRWVWAAAMLGSVGAPAAVWLAQQLRPAGPLPASDVGGVVLHPLLLAASSAVAAPTLDEVLARGWVGLSAALLAALAMGVWLLERRSARWERGVVEGHPVRVAPDTGPAVVGLLRPEVVLPGWAMHADPAERALMLRHEVEHLRARDPQLLLGALLLLVTMPWNPALWWQLRRLRQAMEMDCDTRVLHRAPDVRRYARVLLEVGQRTTRSPLVVASLSQPASLLERRIRRMTSQPNRHTRLWTAAASGVALLCLAVACETPRPQGAITEPEAPHAAAIAAAELNAVPIGEVPNYRPEILNAREVIRAMETGYPSAHRERGAQVVVRFVIDAAGVPQGVEVVKGAGLPGFDAAAAQAMQQARFNAPPRPVIGTMPIVFVPPNREDSKTVMVGDHTILSMTAPAGTRSATAERPQLVRFRELARAHPGEKGKATLSIEPDGSVSDMRIVHSTEDKAVDEAFIALWRTHRFPPSERGHTITVPIVPHYATKP